MFEDGTPVRFWGTNVAAYALYSDKRAIEKHAERLAMLGYNLVRIHHHDSMGWVHPTVIDNVAETTQQLDEEVLDRLDWWIKCLKEQGIYVWLDLHVGRLVKQGDNVGDGFAEMMRHEGNKDKGAGIKGYNYFNPRIEQLMTQFNTKYLNHVNRYTGKAYKDEPAIVSVLITNENDITHHFGNLMLGNKNNPYHHQIFEREARAFAKATGLNPAKTMRTWEAGSSKLFLADQEYLWDQRMIQQLHKIGVRVPIATTQMWGEMPLFGLPALTAGDIIDVHSYGDAEFLSTNPRYKPNLTNYMAMGQAPASSRGHQ